MATKLDVNGAVRSVEASGDMPLLWVLRDLLQLNGTKYGCGISQCGGVHGAPRWQAGSRLRYPGVERRGAQGHDDRRAVA